MSDVQLLFVVLAALYGWECLCWLRRGGVAMIRGLGGRWHAQHPGTLAGNHSGGFVLAQPLPPLGALLVANQIPLSLSPQGVLAFVATTVNPGGRPTQGGRFVKWSDVREILTRGRKILVNGERFVVVATPGLARHLASELKRLTTLQSSERAAAVVTLLQSTLDAEAIAARRAAWQPLALPLCRLANVLVIYALAFAPAAVWSFGLLLSWWWLLPGLLALTMTTAILFARAHRALYPEATDERFMHTLTIALAPTSAMRAHDALSRGLLETFHPLAVARELLDLRTFTGFAGGILRDLRHPALPWSPSEPSDALATERFHRETLLAAVETFLTRHGHPLEQWGRPPAPNDSASRSYCPRCEAQFTSVQSRCTDCGGLVTVPLSPAAE